MPGQPPSAGRDSRRESHGCETWGNPPSVDSEHRRHSNRIEGGGNGLADDLRQRPRQPVDVVLGVEWPRADAHGALGKSANRAMNIRRAVETRPDGDVECLIQDAAQLRRWQRFATETQCADTTRWIAVAEDLEAADLVQAPPKPLRQGDFMTANLFE